MNNAFDPLTLADDFLEVRRIYAEYFDTLDETSWDKPVKGGSKQWTLYEAIAHLCALYGAGLESIQHTLHGKPYTFAGLDCRYEFNAYRPEIDVHLDTPVKALSSMLLDIFSEAANIARSLTSEQAEMTLQMAIYKRPVKIFETLNIILIHAGLFHSAQVAEPSGHLPPWVQLSRKNLIYPPHLMGHLSQ